ncbi:MAG: transcription termination/antitermination protein NusG, partial [Maioricimonas sp. JB049]
PMEEHEISRMLGKEEEAEGARTAQPVVKFGVEIGDTVKVKDGPFESFEGVVDSLDETSGRLKIMVEIFGRSTEVELEHWQVEKV